MGSMVPIAVSESVTIFCTKDGMFSFFNSPYPMHRDLTGIDIYPRREFGDLAPSPVGGRVVRVRKVRCPRSRIFKDAGFDCVILLQSSENPDVCVKILHLEPVVGCGEVVEPGQPLGRLLRSGYFNFWTDPHVHLEVRRPSDPFRARGGYTIHRLLKVEKKRSLEEMRGLVTKSTPEYSLVALKDKLIFGLPAKIGAGTCLLDGGIPHYGWFGVHTNGSPFKGSLVEFNGITIGTIKAQHEDVGIAECADISFLVDDVKVGLSLYLSPSSEPEVKLVPPSLGALRLEESTEVSVDICEESAAMRPEPRDER